MCVSAGMQNTRYWDANVPIATKFSQTSFSCGDISVFINFFLLSEGEAVNLYLLPLGSVTQCFGIFSNLRHAWSQHERVDFVPVENAGL